MPEFNEGLKFEPEKEEEAKKPIQFKEGQIVSVFRTNMDVENDWEVKEINQEKQLVTVINRKKRLAKKVPLEKLMDWNEPGTFLPLQKVLWRTADGIPWPGWKVVGHTGTGLIRIWNKTTGDQEEVKPEELIRDTSHQDPFTDRYELRKKTKK